MLIKIKHLYSRDIDIIEPYYLVPTRQMVADIFTKALDGPSFYVFREYIMNLRTGTTAYAHLQGQSPILAAVAQGSRHIADAAHLYTSPATQTLPAPTATALPQLYTCLRQVGDASQLAD